MDVKAQRHAGKPQHDPVGGNAKSNISGGKEPITGQFEDLVNLIGEIVLVFLLV